MKKLLAILLAVLLLSGCQLATDEPGKNGRLTGFFLTVSRKDGDRVIDVWDEEATGMEMISNHNLAGERLYAAFLEGPEASHYEFPEGCGLSCFNYLVEEEGEEPYHASTISPEISALLEYHAGTSTSYRIDAAVYGTKDTDAVIQVNPVYQTSDGQVYVLSDRPMSYDVATMGGCSVELRQERSGVDGCEVKLTIENVVLPDVYVIIEMDGENRPLRRSEFAPGELPETYTPGSDAAYLLLEAQAGADTVRSVYSPGEDVVVMDTYYPGEYGLCIRGYTTIDWEGAK